jgi:hypothetical protein
MATSSIVRFPATLLLGSVVLALTACGGGSSSSAKPTETTGTTPTAAASNEQVVSSGDCTTLKTVVADLTVGAHTDEVVAPFHDITAKDYERDRDFIAGYLAQAPEAIRADVELLGRWIDHYATAAQAAGVAPGVVPTFEQMIEINGGAYMDSLEQDRLLPAIQALGIWADGGCSGDRPVIAPPPPPAEATETIETPTNPLAKASAEAALGESVEEVADAVNEVISGYTERELGSPPLGSEVRNCRKARELSENSLIAPGGTGFVCEIWYEGDLWRDGGIAVIDAEGKVFTTP